MRRSTVYVMRYVNDTLLSKFIADRWYIQAVYVSFCIHVPCKFQLYVVRKLLAPCGRKKKNSPGIYQAFREISSSCPAVARMSLGAVPRLGDDPLPGSGIRLVPDCVSGAVEPAFYVAAVWAVVVALGP